MKFSELMKNLEHEDLEFITKYGEIKEYQDEYFYTITPQNSDLMQKIKSKVSEKKPMFPYLSNGDNLSEVKKAIKKEKDEFKITLPYHIFIPNYIEDYDAEKDLDISKIREKFEDFYAGDEQAKCSLSKWYLNQNTANTK